jgi:tetratricopeptide (TPR) repeat protein
MIENDCRRLDATRRHTTRGIKGQAVPKFRQHRRQRVRNFCLAALALGIVCSSAAAPTPKESVRGQLDAAANEAKLFGFVRAHDLAQAALATAEPSTEDWQWAVFLAALCAHQASPPTPAMIERAGDLYRLLLEKTPDSRYAPRAVMNLGRIEELADTYGDQPDLAAARRWYEEVVERWPDRAIAGEATLRIAGTHLQSFEGENVQKGIGLLKQWLDAHPEDPLASGMWQVMADAYFYPLAEPGRSLACYEQADRIGLLETGREGPIYWRMAVLADRFLEDRQRAVIYYTRIIEKTPASGKAYEAQLALARLGAPVPKIRIFKEPTGSDGTEGAE